MADATKRERPGNAETADRASLLSRKFAKCLRFFPTSAILQVVRREERRRGKGLRDGCGDLDVRFPAAEKPVADNWNWRCRQSLMAEHLSCEVRHEPSFPFVGRHFRGILVPLAPGLRPTLPGPPSRRSTILAMDLGMQVPSAARRGSSPPLLADRSATRSPSPAGTCWWLS